MTAKISNRWIKNPATWKNTNPPIHKMNRTIAIPRNGPSLMFSSGSYNLKVRCRRTTGEWSSQQEARKENYPFAIDESRGC
jgi:hypothetical protein